MRHKYATRGIVVGRAPFGEAHARLAIVTEELGLVHARAAGLRKLQSKLAHALTTFCESDVVLVAGSDGWRLAGAVLAENWFARLATAEARERAGRVASLLVRLSPGEAPECTSYPLFAAYLRALVEGDPALGEAAELVAAEAVLAFAGVGEGGATSAPPDFGRVPLTAALRERTALIARINRGIAASGL